MRYKYEGADPPPEPTWTWRVKVIAALILGVLAALAITAWFLARDGARIAPQSVAAEPAAQPWDTKDEEYKPAREIEAPAANQAFAEPVTANQAATQAAPPPDPFASARTSGIYISAANNEALDGTKFPGGSGGGGCHLKAGTVIIADQINATTNTNPGPVIAQVAHDVLGEGGCDGIRAGSTFVGAVEQGAQYGASRGNYVFTTLEPIGKPPIDLQSAALDAMGRGGVPSEVDYHTGKIATRVAVASFVQILDAGASYFANPFLAAPTQEAGSAVNNWANQALTQAPTITTDPLKRRSRLTIILEKAIDV